MKGCEVLSPVGPPPRYLQGISKHSWAGLLQPTWLCVYTPHLVLVLSLQAKTSPSSGIIVVKARQLLSLSGQLWSVWNALQRPSSVPSVQVVILSNPISSTFTGVPEAPWCGLGRWACWDSGLCG